ncbi:MAG TPA: CocE/NonD family hydrolase, partial [Thermoanaerobaculia bacterium]
MRIVASFPRAVREIEHLRIPLSDGCRLSARVWLPEDAETDPVPAILEYLPYRKRDFTRARDEPMHRYFAGHGYAAVRVDLRGSGDSEGLLTDEYTERELADAEEVIAWIAAQPWCSGKVGMMGISWGGINSLQVAARRPPALAAIITLCSTDDRYADDAHYMGGCLLNENLTWGSVLLTFNAYPPDPETFGPGWRDAWLERLAAAPLFPERWMRHPFRDAYWRHGSVCEGYAAVRCPVYAVGGWADGYSNAVPRLLGGLRCPRKGLIGPWSHAFPHDALPGPSIGFLQEALRWWDHWLKGRETGVMDEPMLRVWMQESVPPRGSYEVRPGRWVAEETWPPPEGRIEPRVLAVNAGRLEETPGEEVELLLCSPQTTGRAGGDWCAFGAEGELPGEQRADDGRSLTFDTAPLAERLEVLGAPEAELELVADCPEALLAVRLCDVAPDGASARVTYGLLNLAHRDRHEHPEPLEPGRLYRVRVRLNDVAHAFPAGHAIRLAVSTSYWPMAWPSPEPVTLSLFAGEGRLTLPVRLPRPEDGALRPFEPPEQAPTLAHTALRPARFRRTVERDLATDETTQIIEGDGGEFEGAALARVEDIDLELGTQVSRRYSIREHDPLSAKAEVHHTTRLRRRDWQIEIETHTRLTADRHRFRLEAELRAHEGEQLV